MTPIRLASNAPINARLVEAATAIISQRDTAAPVGASAKLSDAALLLRAALDGLALPSTSATPSAAAPLIKPGASASALSERVRNAVVQSGLFYEAHQARWLVGKFDIEALRQEPQGKTLAPPQMQLAAAALVEAGAQTARAATSEDSGQAGGAKALNVPPALLPQLERQLHFLLQGELCWRGEAWPGQALEWRLAQRDEPSHAENAADRSWHTTLRMQLPQLGDVQAQLRVTGANISVRLNGEEHAVARFTQALPQLGQAFAAAGIALQSATVQRHE